jgi:hypothetical protein
VDQIFERLAISRAGAQHKALILVVGELSASGLLIVTFHLQFGRMISDNLPLPALFEEDQGRSAVDAPGLAVFGYARKHVASIYDTYGIAVHATRWLPEAEAR